MLGVFLTLELRAFSDVLFHLRILEVFVNGNTMCDNSGELVHIRSARASDTLSAS